MEGFKQEEQLEAIPPEKAGFGTSFEKPEEQSESVDSVLFDKICEKLGLPKDTEQWSDADKIKFAMAYDSETKK